MSVSGGKSLVLKYENNEVIFKLIDEEEKEIDSVSMDAETSAVCNSFKSWCGNC